MQLLEQSVWKVVAARLSAIYDSETEKRHTKIKTWNTDVFLTWKNVLETFIGSFAFLSFSEMCFVQSLNISESSKQFRGKLKKDIKACYDIYIVLFQDFDNKNIFLNLLIILFCIIEW